MSYFFAIHQVEIGSAWDFLFATIFWSLLVPWWNFPQGRVGDDVSLLGNLASSHLPVWALMLWMVVLGTIEPFALVVRRPASHQRDPRRHYGNARRRLGLARGIAGPDASYPAQPLRSPASRWPRPPANPAPSEFRLPLWGEATAVLRLQTSANVY